MPANIGNQKYFRGFNTLRFYASLSVLVQHVSHSPHDWFGTPLLPVTLERFFLNGSDAVNLFFVLSGFLITYLLLNEQERTGTVSIRNFYIRRALRIYPVYFLFLFGVIILLQPQYPPLLLFLLTFFMGNIAFVTFFPFPPLEHLWSIGVEEQYYAFAPFLIRFRAHAAKIALAIIGVWWLILLVSSLLPTTPLTAFVQMSRYDLIALGALIAFGAHHDWAALKLIRRRSVLAVALAVIVYAIVFVPPPTTVLHSTLLGLAFAVIIYHIAFSEQFTKRFDYPALEYLGKLSYSMYVYHPLFVLIIYGLLYTRLSLPLYQLVAYPAVIILTIVVSWLSYEKIERFFLTRKNRFHSRDQQLEAVAAE